MKKEKLTCLFFGEGRKESSFYRELTEHQTFNYHTKNWRFSFDHGPGSATDVLNKCNRSISGISYDLVLCFVDTDLLKSTYGSRYKKEKEKIENNYKNISVIWQESNLEEEIQKVLGKKFNKHKTNLMAKKNISEFINSDIYKRILKEIKNKEKSILG